MSDVAVNPDRVANFHDAALQAADRVHGRVVRFDVDRRGRLTALLELPPSDPGSLPSLRGAWLDDRDEIVWFAPEEDPRLFRSVSWDAFRARWWEGWSLEPVAYRPLKRVVFRAIDPGGEVRYVKLRNARLSDERVHIVHRFERFPRLLGRRGMSGLSAEVWTDVGSVALRDRLRRSDGATWIRPVVRALLALSKTNGVPIPVTDVSAIAADTRLSLNRAAALGSRIAPAAFDLVDVIESSLAVDDVTFVTAHGDCHDAQILLDGDEVRLLDPDALCRAPLEWDIATLAAHVDLAELRDTEIGLDAPAIQARLFDAFDGAARRAEVPATPSFGRFDQLRRLVLLRLAGVYGRRPQWKHLSAPLFERARAAHVATGTKR